MPYRDADTGEYVDEDYALAHPDTTIHEDDEPDDDEPDTFADVKD